MPTKNNRKKVSASQRPKRAPLPSTDNELDSVYILKLVIYLMIGSFWVRITNGISWQIPIPLGFIIGIVLASHEHFRIDRKVEYALLVTVMSISYWLPIGLDIAIG